MFGYTITRYDYPDNMFFGNTHGATVAKDGKQVYDAGPPFARLQAVIWIIGHFKS